jgi:hypothetical protein
MSTADDGCHTSNMANGNKNGPIMVNAANKVN